MINARSRRYRPSVQESLEVRVVPTSGFGHGQVAVAAINGTSAASAVRLARLQAELTTAGTQIHAAYATFATSVREVERMLMPTSSGTVPPLNLIVSDVNLLSFRLGNSVQAALGLVPKTAGPAAIVSQAIAGSGPASLDGQIEALITAASSSGTVSSANLPLLYSAVEGVMSISLNSTSIEGLLAGLGSAGFVPPAPVASSPVTVGAFNLKTFNSAANSAYSTFAASIRAAERSVPTEPVSAAGTGTIASATTAGVAAANTLAGSLSLALEGTTAEYFAQLRPPEESVALADLGGLLTVAAPDGTVPVAEIPLVYAIGEAAINGSYVSTQIQGYLISRIV